MRLPPLGPLFVALLSLAPGAEARAARARAAPAGVVALRIGLRYALSGPLGVILTGAAAVSLASYLVKNQKEITTKVSKFRTLIADTRTRFEETQGGYRAGRYDAASRNLMVDGLLKRFLAEVDAD